MRTIDRFVQRIQRLGSPFEFNSSSEYTAVQSNEESPLQAYMNHDLQHQVRLVREALRSEKRRLGFFLGAGCPLGIYD
jgi:hypothetical protein